MEAVSENTSCIITSLNLPVPVMARIVKLKKPFIILRLDEGMATQSHIYIYYVGWINEAWPCLNLESESE